MDYLLVIGLNVGLAAGLYIVLSMRLSRNLYEFGKTNFENQIRALVIDFYRESEGYLVKLEARIKEYKNLIQKGESLAERLENFERLSPAQLASPKDETKGSKKKTAKKKATKGRATKARTRKASDPAHKATREKPAAGRSAHPKSSSQNSPHKPSELMSGSGPPLPPVDDIDDQVDIHSHSNTPSSAQPDHQHGQRTGSPVERAESKNPPTIDPTTANGASAPGPPAKPPGSPAQTQEPTVVRILGSIGRALGSTFTGSETPPSAPPEQSFFERQLTEAAQEELKREDRQKMQRQKSDPYGFSPEDINEQVDVGNANRSMKDDMDALTNNINRILAAAGRDERAGQPDGGDVSGDARSDVPTEVPTDNPRMETTPLVDSGIGGGPDITPPSSVQSDKLPPPNDTIPPEFIDPAEAQRGEAGRIIEASEPVYQVNMDSVRAEILNAGLSREETVLQLAETGLETPRIAGLMAISEAEVGLIRQMYSGR